MTPPISMPVSSTVMSALANEALRTSSRRRIRPLTSSRVVARVTQATWRIGSPLPVTRIVFAESSRATP